VRGVVCPFNGLVRSLLVRHGEDAKIDKCGHIFNAVYREMFLQICRDYPGLPNARDLKAKEILFFYEGLRPELKEHTKPNG